MIQLQGFAPDADPTTPGVVVDCENFIPYEAGMEAAPSAVDALFTALPSTCLGSAVTRDLAGSSKFFAGTSTNLYEASGTSWSSVGSGYSASLDETWKFAVFGNTPLVTCKSQKIKRYTGGAFVDITAAPKARFVVVAKGFVVALNTDEATYSDSPDRWWCSALLDETDWTPNIATQCATGRLTEGSGPITAGIRMGDSVVAYKERCIFVGSYVGGDAVWAWTPPIGDAGCVGGEAVVDTPAGNVFVGSDNIYIFDGTRPLPIATEQVRQWWLNDSDPAYRYRTKLLWDRENSRVWIFYPRTSDDGVCGGVLVYHIMTKQWGRLTKSVEAVLNYSSPGMTYDGLGSYTYETLPAVSYDSPFWIASKSSPAFFGADHKVYSFSGIPEDSYFVTNDFGGDVAYSMCRALRVRYSALPSVSSCSGFTKTTSGTTSEAGSSASFDGSKYPMRQTGRFHSFKVSITGAAKVSGVSPDLVEAGTR